jgi:hypothetical protein
MPNQPSVHRWIVDSIEESMASVEVDGDKLMPVPVAMLPRGTKQGDILRVSIEIDAAATKAALAESAAQVKKGGARQANDPGGDITL